MRKALHAALGSACGALPVSVPMPALAGGVTGFGHDLAFVIFRQEADAPRGRGGRRIHARAIKRCGKLLKQIKPGKTGPKLRGGAPPQSRKQAARDAGLSDDQRKTALRVASVPNDEFEAPEVPMAAPSVTVEVPPSPARMLTAVKRDPLNGALLEARLA